MSEALEALYSGLDAQQSSRLTAFVAEATARAVGEYGVAPSIDEIVSNPWAREATYAQSGVEWNNALWHLGQTETVQKHNAAKVAQGEAPALPKNYAESGVVTEADIAALPPILRNWVKPGATADDIAAIGNVHMKVALGRALSLPHAVRNPTLGDQRDPTFAAWQDARDMSELSPAEKMARARREGASK